MKTALIGLGRMGQQHLAALLSEPEAELVALCDPAAQPAEFDLPLTDYDSILADQTVAAVLIAAPTNLHESLVTQALRAGKHVFCEKPLTLDPARDLALCALARDQGLRLHIGFWRRFAAPYRAFFQQLRQGDIGTLSALRLSQWDSVAPPLSFCDPKVSGGIEIDCGVHELDLIDWLTQSDLARLSALSAKPSDGFASCDDIETLFAQLQTSAGHLVSIDLTRTAGGADSLRTEAIGQAGSLIVEITEDAELTLRKADGTVTQQRFARPVIPDALRAQYRDFKAAVLAGRSSPDSASADHSARALTGARLLQISRLRDGDWLTVKPMDHPEAAKC